MLENLIIKRGGLEGKNKSEMEIILIRENLKLFSTNKAILDSSRTDRFVS